MTITSHLIPLKASLESINLDPNNPRFWTGTAKPVPITRFCEQAIQDRALERMQSHDLASLMSSIEANGFLPMDRLVVQKIPNSKPLAYFVLEGNRRLAACKELLNDHVNGDCELAPQVLESIQIFEVLEYIGSETNMAWALQGVRHITGIRDWPPEQQAKHIADLMASEDISATQAGKRLGLTGHKPGRIVRSYFALQQLRENEEWGDRATTKHFSMFEEACKSPKIRTWLGWNDAARKFTNADAVADFYRLFLGPEENDGEEVTPQLSQAIQIRHLSEFLEDDDLMDRLRSDIDFSVESAWAEHKQESGATATWEEQRRKLRSAIRALKHIPANALIDHREEAIALLERGISHFQKIRDLIPED